MLFLFVNHNIPSSNNSTGELNYIVRSNWLLSRYARIGYILENRVYVQEGIAWKFVHQESYTLQ